MRRVIYYSLWWSPLLLIACIALGLVFAIWGDVWCVKMSFSGAVMSLAWLIGATLAADFGGDGKKDKKGGGVR